MRDYKNYNPTTSNHFSRADLRQLVTEVATLFAAILLIGVIVLVGSAMVNTRPPQKLSGQQAQEVGK